MINEVFFSKIENDSAYVLGLLFSDGYLCKHKKSNKKYACIKLIDEQILQDISRVMSFEAAVKKCGFTSAGNQLYKLTFNQNQIINDLEKNGLHERKTFTIKFPDQISNECIPDFIRGYFDGDGCIHVSVRKNRVNSLIKNFSVLGTENILLGIQKHLPCKSYIKKYRNIFRLTVNKENDIKKIYNFLYGNNPTLKLERKKTRFEETIQLLNQSKNEQKVHVKKKQSPRLTTAEFEVKARKIHGEVYDYSQAEFEKVNKPVKIICKKHGTFNQLPLKHLIGHGCTKCSGSYMDNNYFKEKAILIHGGKYNYGLVHYVKKKKKVLIICPNHGIFEQTPSNHLLGRGCKQCSADRRKKKKEEKKAEQEKM